MSEKAIPRTYRACVIEISDAAYTEIRRALQEKHFEAHIEQSQDGRELIYLDNVRVKAKMRPAL